MNNLRTYKVFIIFILTFFIQQNAKAQINVIENADQKTIDLLLERKMSQNNQFSLYTNYSVQLKNGAKEEVETIKNTDSSKDTSIKDKKTEDVVKKPLAYMKLFVFSVLSFIFENKIVFYGLIILVVFFIFKRIFQSFRHK